MKKVLLLLLLFVSLLANAQLILLDEPIGQVGEGFVYSVAIHDNDIVYCMSKTKQSFQPGVFLSNGVKEDRKEILENNSVRAYFKPFNSFYTPANIYGDNVYEAGNRKFAEVFSSTGSLGYYEFNSTRTSLTPNNIIKNKIYPLGKGKGFVMLDTLHSQNQAEKKIRLKHFTNLGQINTYELGLLTNYAGFTPFKFFIWKNAVYYMADNFISETDFYKVDALNNIRITQNKHNRSSSSFRGAITYNNFYLTEEYIYFSGTDGEYYNDTNGILRSRQFRGISYTNGDIDFGSLDLQIENGDDGGLGYRTVDPLGDNVVPEKIIGIIEDKVVFENYRRNSSSSIYHSITKSGEYEDLTIPNNGSESASDSRTYHYKDKIYITKKDKEFSAPWRRYERIYVTDGTKDGTQSYVLPSFPNTDLKPERAAFTRVPFKVLNNKLYFAVVYIINGDNKYGILSINTETNEIKTEILFTNDVITHVVEDITVADFFPYNNGLVIQTNESLYTWNVDIRSRYFSPNQNKSESKTKNNDNSLDYQGKEYSFNFANTSLEKSDDSFKIQLLDTLSSKFKHVIKALPTNIEKGKVSHLFYTINTLEETNKYTSDITIGFQKEMFNNDLSLKADELSILAFYNETWNEIIPTSFDEVNKTVTFSGGLLPSDVSIFLKSSGVLSTENIELNSKSLSLYPNPVKSTLNISLKNNELIEQVDLYNLVGQKVYQKKLPLVKKAKANLSHLASNIYIIKIKTQNSIYSGKIVLKSNDY